MGELAKRVSQELLPFVRQPAQYIGGEVNSAVRSWPKAEVRIALAFPDTYALGMSHLGSAILYSIANRIDGVACERVYAPWTDAERIMRDRAIPLFTWDSRQPVASADVLAFSLQYEMHFANVLNMLDLAGMALRTADRLGEGRGDAETRGRREEGGQSPFSKETEKGDGPLVIAGGPQADNPEPLAEFIDLFVIGDGEAAFPAIIDAAREAKRAGRSRRELLLELARRYEWAYVPSLYSLRYTESGTIAKIIRNAEFAMRNENAPAGHRAAGVDEEEGQWRFRREEGGQSPFSKKTEKGDSPQTEEGDSPLVRRARVEDLDAAEYPAEQLVPWSKAVHERITLELMRGCPQGCRFCHAGYTKRPIVWRSVECLLDQAERAYRATGFEEIALTSLSTSDYPHLDELLVRLRERFAPRHVSISVPSLRVDKQLALIPLAVGDVRKSGLTIAAEAAREPMRQRIGKRVSDEELLAGVRAAYAAGWRSVKLYFMVGLPGETEDDVRGIVELAKRVAWERTRTELPAGASRGPASVVASVSPLVPKPHTPMQWSAQRDGKYFWWARNLLRELAARSPVQIKFHRIERSLLEGVLARGDRRVGRAIELAWRAGARFDGWDEQFDYDRWLRAFAEAGLDPAFYSQRQRPFDEVLPWDHIESGTPRRVLERWGRELLLQS